MRKAQVLGFTIVLILTLTLAGLTCYKGAEILGLYKTDQALDSFNTLARTINITYAQPEGTRNSLPIRIDEETAIVGWGRGSQMVMTTTGMNHYDPRPAECKTTSNACICLCRHYDWSVRLWYGIDIDASMKCREKWQCYNYPPEIDFPVKLGKEQFGLSYEVEGGFFISKNTNFIGSVSSKYVESRLKGLYVEKASGVMGVMFNPDGLTPDVIKHQTDYNTAKNTYFEAHNAYGAKSWDLAITKYNELINSKLVELLPDVEHDEAYWFLGMAYYQKGETQNAITALQTAAENVNDMGAYDAINKKIVELGGQPSIRHEPDITMG